MDGLKEVFSAPVGQPPSSTHRGSGGTVSMSDPGRQRDRIRSPGLRPGDRLLSDVPVDRRRQVIDADPDGHREQRHHHHRAVRLERGVHLGTPSPALPANLAAGSSLTVPVTFTPTVGGLAGGSVTIATRTTEPPRCRFRPPARSTVRTWTSPPTASASAGSPGPAGQPGSRLLQQRVLDADGVQRHEPGAPFSHVGAPVAGTPSPPVRRSSST